MWTSLFGGGVPPLPTVLRHTTLPKMSAAPKSLLPAKQLIERSCAEPLNVAALAYAVKLSPAHFSREFSRVFGDPPHRYLIACRMQRAAALLRTGDGDIADVCRAVGLRSVGSFTTMFTRTFGISPAAYRAAHRSSSSGRSCPEP